MDSWKLDAQAHCDGLIDKEEAAAGEVLKQIAADFASYCKFTLEQ
jgi:hypothetical protein